MPLFPFIFGVREICVFISCGFFSFWLLVKMLAKFDPPLLFFQTMIRTNSALPFNNESLKYYTCIVQCNCWCTRSA